MFWEPLFWGLLIPCLIVLGILYGTTKKVYKLFYVLALFVYVIAVAYIIDVFSLGRNWILGLLVFSAILMILIAAWLSRNGKKKAKRGVKRRAPSKRNLWILLGFLAVMLLLIVVSSLGTGVTRTVTIAQSLERTNVIVELPQDQSYGRPPAVDAANFTYTNSFFLPIVVEDQYFLACWYNTTTQTISSEQLQTQVNGQQNEYRVGDEPMAEVPPGGTLTLAVAVTGASYYDVKAPIPTSAYAQYDAIVLASFRERDYLDCSRLPLMKDDESKIASYNVIPLT